MTIWLALVAGGLSALMRYDVRPGETAEVPPVWPAGVPWSHAREGHTVVVALHPFCPCSEATLATLGQLMARAPGRLQVHLLFMVAPDGGDATATTATAFGREAVRASRLWRAAAPLRAERHLDPGGALADRFGAMTSGAVVVFAPDG